MADKHNIKLLVWSKKECIDELENPAKTIFFAVAQRFKGRMADPFGSIDGGEIKQAK